MPIKSPVDVLVIAMLVTVIFGLVTAFVRAKRPKLWRRLWLLWGIAFLVIELVGAPFGQTLSENIVGSLPLWVVIAGTWVVAAILSIHWWDLARRIAVFSK